jgi:hypothetical protein
MIKTLTLKGKYDFREAYGNLPRNVQPRFRRTVMASQNWDSRNAFYAAMRGDIWLNPEQVEEIKTIFRQMGQEVA